MDGSSNSYISGASVILDNGSGLIVEVSLRFNFPATNNQAKYKAVTVRVTFA